MKFMTKKVIASLLVAIFVLQIFIVLTFRNTYADFLSEADVQVSQVETMIQTGVNFLDYMAILAQEHYSEGNVDPLPMYDELEYDYSLEVFGLTEDVATSSGYIGNVIGVGTLPASEEVISDINLAIKYNAFFKSLIYKTNNVSWAYFIAESGVVGIYPYVSTTNLSTAMANFKEKDYYKKALPENNPNRDVVWSSIYEDEGGTGQVVTVAKPIYDQNDFKGVVALDYTVSSLSDVFVGKYDAYLCESDGSVIASSSDLSMHMSTEELQHIISKDVQGTEFVDGNLVYTHSIKNTDWTYISLISIGDLFASVILKVSPVVIPFFGLMVLFIYQNEKRIQSGLEAQVLKRTEEIKAMQEINVMGLANLTETRDNETGRHIIRTRNYVAILAQSLSNTDEYCHELTPEKIEKIYLAAPLHDVGKVGVRDAILNKPGKLTDEEREEMQNHSIIGYNALQQAYGVFGQNSFVDCALEIIRSHHERWDGTGYPDRLVGQNIPLSARIMAVADVYDALTSKRVYKNSMSHEKARKIIISESGKAFDPLVVAAFIEMEDEFIRVLEKYSVEE